MSSSNGSAVSLSNGSQEYTLLEGCLRVVRFCDSGGRNADRTRRSCSLQECGEMACRPRNLCSMSKKRREHQFRRLLGQVAPDEGDARARREIHEVANDVRRRQTIGRFWVKEGKQAVVAIDPLALPQVESLAKRRGQPLVAIGCDHDHIGEPRERTRLPGQR